MSNAKNDDWVDEEVPTKVSKKASKKPQPKGKNVKSKKKPYKKPGGKSGLKVGEKVTINYKILPTVAKQHKAKARLLTNGNVTQMVVRAVAAWNPSKKELEGIRKSTAA